MKYKMNLWNDFFQCQSSITTKWYETRSMVRTILKGYEIVLNFMFLDILVIFIKTKN